MRKLKECAQSDLTGGFFLIGSAALALVIAQLPQTSQWYQSLFGASAAHSALPKLIVNDVLMAIFFLLVTLEIKREVVAGALSCKRTLMLPAFAAIGGVLVPATIYIALNFSSTDLLAGWPIPSSTDIAFSLGVLALLGDRVPIALKLFLASVAIVDDLAAIAIIAICYTNQVAPIYLAMSLFSIVGLFLLGARKSNSLTNYILLGTALGIFLHHSGIHTTLAGVVLGVSIPFSKNNPNPLFDRLEHGLKPWVQLLILPLFAFANSGIPLSAGLSQSFVDPMTLSILLGLVVGKPLGILIFSIIAVYLKLARLPENVDWQMLTGAGMLAGIGFTMSIFIGNLAFGELDSSYLIASRLGILSGSLLSAVMGWGYLFILTRNNVPYSTSSTSVLAKIKISPLKSAGIMADRYSGEQVKKIGQRLNSRGHLHSSGIRGLSDGVGLWG